MASMCSWYSSSVNIYSHLMEAENMTDSSVSMINVTSFPSDCIELRFEEYIPWDNPDNIVSFETENIMYTVFLLVFLPACALISCPANIINMIVFYKHGLKERINLCLFALSLADEMYMISCILFYGDQFYLLLTTKEKVGTFLAFLINNGLVGVHTFIWVSQVLSAVIAFERCLCVLLPLRSQTLLPTSRMAIIIVAIHVIILGLGFFYMLRYEVRCAIDPFSGGKSLSFFFSEFYFRHQQFIDFLDIFVLGIGLSGFAMIVVITTTIITAIKLRQAALWRAGTSSQSGMSERDVALTKMLVFNSIFFAFCLVPFVVFRFVFFFNPKISAGGRQHNLFLLAQEILVIISFVNSTFNFVIYYTMGSRYRQTFWQLFGRIKKINKRSAIKTK